MLQILVIIFIGVWTIPFLIKSKPGKEVKKRITIAFLVGTIPNFFLGLLASGKLEKLVIFLFPKIPDFLPLPIGAGIGEEVVKCGIALCFARKLKNGRPIDYIMIFGVVGAGFNLVESLMIGQNIISVFARSILAMHVIWLYFDGMGYVQMLEGKKFALLRNFLITIFLHFFFDLGFTLLEDFDGNDNLTTVGFLIAAISILLNLILLIISVRRMRKESSLEVVNG